MSVVRVYYNRDCTFGLKTYRFLPDRTPQLDNCLRSLDVSNIIRFVPRPQDGRPRDSCYDPSFSRALIFRGALFPTQNPMDVSMA